MELPTPDSLARDILQDALTMTLAVADEEGPWAAPVVFINPAHYDICWISLPTTRHSLALAKSPRVAFSIVASDNSTAERALQISARVEKMDGPNLAWEQMLEAKRGLALPQHAGDILDQGYEWYRARPEAVYLIHLERYGFDRQRVI